ncbi:uncharacterized protein LOC120329755 [Styela clava]
MCDNRRGLNYIARWETSTLDYKWMITNKGEHIEIETIPRRSLISHVEDEKLFVDKIYIKWKSGKRLGSRHSFAGQRKAAEIGIIHEKHATLGRIGFTFLIKTRHNPPNVEWKDLIEAVTTNRTLGTRTMISNPPSLENFLSDTHNRRGRHIRHILNQPMRYEQENGCGKVTWFIFTRIIHISTSQLTLLKSLGHAYQSTKSLKRYRARNICITRN